MSDLSQFLPGRIKSIQRGTITITGATSNIDTITSVDTAKSILTMLGSESSETTVSNTSVRLALTNSTTITASRNGSTGTVIVGYQVVEYV
jgi:hypothetical protein